MYFTSWIPGNMVYLRATIFVFLQISMQICLSGAPREGKDVYFDEILKKLRSCSTVCDASARYHSVCQEKCPYYQRTDVFFNQILSRWQNCSSVCDPPNRYEDFCTDNCPNYTTTASSAISSISTPAAKSTVVEPLNALPVNFTLTIIGTIGICVLIVLSVVILIIYKKRKWFYYKIKGHRNCLNNDSSGHPVQESCALQGSLSSENRNIAAVQSVQIANEIKADVDSSRSHDSSNKESRRNFHEKIPEAAEINETLRKNPISSCKETQIKQLIGSTKLNNSSAYFSKTVRGELGSNSLPSFREKSAIQAKTREFFDTMNTSTRSAEPSPQKCLFLAKKSTDDSIYHNPVLNDDLAERMGRRLDNENDMRHIENIDSDSEFEFLESEEGSRELLMTTANSLTPKYQTTKSGPVENIRLEVVTKSKSNERKNKEHSNYSIEQKELKCTYTKL